MLCLCTGSTFIFQFILTGTVAQVSRINVLKLMLYICMYSFCNWCGAYATILLSEILRLANPEICVVKVQNQLETMSRMLCALNCFNIRYDLYFTILLYVYLCYMCAYS